MAIGSKRFRCGFIPAAGFSVVEKGRLFC